MDLIKEISPDVVRLGVPYNPGEANAVSLVAALSEMAPEWGIELVEAPATSTSEVPGAIASVVGWVDAISVPTDNTIVSALEAVIAVGQDNGIPVYAGDTDSVRRGAIASVGFDYYQIGRQTGEIVARILGGEAPGDIAVRSASGTDLFVNLSAAAAMGVALPQAVIDRAIEVVE